MKNIMKSIYAYIFIVVVFTSNFHTQAGPGVKAAQAALSFAQVSPEGKPVVTIIEKIESVVGVRIMNPISVKKPHSTRYSESRKFVNGSLRATRTPVSYANRTSSRMEDVLPKKQHIPYGVSTPEETKPSGFLSEVQEPTIGLGEIIQPVENKSGIVMRRYDIALESENAEIMQQIADLNAILNDSSVSHYQKILELNGMINVSRGFIGSTNEAVHQTAENIIDAAREQKIVIEQKMQEESAQ